MSGEDWLKDRLAESPEPLRRHLEERVADLETGPALSDALVTAACDVLEGVRVRVERREAAFDLLVADGLLTLACEAAAYADPEGLAERCREMGPSGALGRVSERWVGRD